MFCGSSISDMHCTQLSHNETDNELDKSRSLSYCDLTFVQCIFTNALANMNYLYIIKQNRQSFTRKAYCKRH